MLSSEGCGRKDHQVSLPANLHLKCIIALANQGILLPVTLSAKLETQRTQRKFRQDQQDLEDIELRRSKYRGESLVKKTSELVSSISDLPSFRSFGSLLHFVEEILGSAAL
jgi:hypothetical protein